MLCLQNLIVQPTPMRLHTRTAVHPAVNFSSSCVPRRRFLGPQPRGWCRLGGAKLRPRELGAVKPHCHKTGDEETAKGQSAAEQTEEGYAAKRPNWRKKYMRYLPFEEARKCAQGLNFDSREMWEDWVDEGKKSPYLGPYMPSDPESMYAENGWTDWEDFLGVPYPFEVARDYARGLGLASVQEWWEWCETDKPARMPSRPNWTYRDDGWISYEDFLDCEPPEPFEITSADLRPEDGYGTEEQAGD